MGFSLKSVTKAVAKPFKDVGKAIHWTDIRYPVVGAALAATGVGLAGYGALTATGLTGAAIGAGLGQQFGSGRSLAKSLNAQYSLASQQAEDIAQAQVVPVVQTAPQISQSTELADSNTAADNRRRYSLQRTVNNYSLRSSLGLGGGNKYSLG